MVMAGSSRNREVEGHALVQMVRTAEVGAGFEDKCVSSCRQFATKAGDPSVGAGHLVGEPVARPDQKDPHSGGGLASRQVEHVSGECRVSTLIEFPRGASDKPVGRAAKIRRTDAPRRRNLTCVS